MGSGDDHLKYKLGVGAASAFPTHTRAGAQGGRGGRACTEPTAGRGRHHRRVWRPLWRPRICRCAGETWGADDSSFGRRRHRLCLPTHARGAQGGRRVESVQDPLSAGGAIIGAFGALHDPPEICRCAGETRGATDAPFGRRWQGFCLFPHTRARAQGGRGVEFVQRAASGRGRHRRRVRRPLWRLKAAAEQGKRRGAKDSPFGRHGHGFCLSHARRTSRWGPAGVAFRADGHRGGRLSPSCVPPMVPLERAPSGQPLGTVCRWIV
jgi:hypothetical protein